jgi:hypothetical protein
LGGLWPLLRLASGLKRQSDFGLKRQSDFGLKRQSDFGLKRQYCSYSERKLVVKIAFLRPLLML